MRRIFDTKFLRLLLILALAAGFYAWTGAAGCSGGPGGQQMPEAGEGATGAPLITIPAPTSNYINVTAPNADGKVLVYGYIYADESKATVAKGATTKTVVPLSGVTVIVTNAATGDEESTTTDSTGFFSVLINGSIGDSIEVKYIDPETGEESQTTTIVVTNETSPLSAADGMKVKSVAVGPGDFAYVVSNDGTNSEISKIDMDDGATLSTTAKFSGKKFDRIAIHKTMNFAAVLDTSAKKLYWYNLSNLADDMAATSMEDISTTPTSVAVSDVANVEIQSAGMVIVAHDVNNVSGIISLYMVSSDATPTLGIPTTDNCLGHPDDNAYPACDDVIIGPTGATHVDVTKTSEGSARLAFVATYDDNGTTKRAVHFSYFDTYTELGPMADFAEPYVSQTHGAGAMFYDMAWYDGDTVLLTDNTNGNLLKFKDSSGEMGSETLAVGTDPTGIAVDESNGRAFVAVRSANAILTVDMSGFVLGDDSYDANYGPTWLVHDDGIIGMILTEPMAMFGVVGVP